MTPVISDPESVEAALSDLARTTEEIITLEELQQLLLSGRRLRMKYGVDLTAPELHLVLCSLDAVGEGVASVAWGRRWAAPHPRSGAASSATWC
jgi:hypothetical protein